jgi:hypothetical protein
MSVVGNNRKRRDKPVTAQNSSTKPRLVAAFRRAKKGLKADIHCVLYHSTLPLHRSVFERFLGGEHALWRLRAIGSDTCRVRGKRAWTFTFDMHLLLDKSHLHASAGAYS